MLSQTKENLQDLMNKIQVLDYVLQTLKLIHKDHEKPAEEAFKRASTHKLKLVDEVLRLSNANEVTPLTAA